MLQVYAIPVSLYCAKLRILLRHKGLAWGEIPPPGGYGSDAYKAHVASGNLPALRDGELLIADSEAIAEYLDELHPAPPMLPASPAARAKIRERSRFHDTRLEPALRAVFPYLSKQGPAPETVIAAQAREITARLSQLARLLDPDAGAELSLGDCGHPVTFAWLEALGPRIGMALEWPEPVIAYRERLSRLPAVAAELADYTPKLTAFLDD